MDVSLDSFEALRQEIFRLHREANYDEALALLERSGSQFPDRLIRIDYWRICFHALKGDTEPALAVLESLLDRGDWIGESLLRYDPDLASLQASTAFERLVTLAEQRRAQAQLQVTPARIVIKPDSDGTAPLLLVLHGNHDDAERHLRYWRPLVESGWLLLVPQASLLGADPTRYVWPDDDTQAFDEILEHIAVVQQTLALDLSRVIICGFSRGAGLAAKLALGERLPARGFIAVAPGFNVMDSHWERVFANSAGQQGRGVVVLGGQDGSYRKTQAFLPNFAQAGVAVRLIEDAATGHDYPLNFEAVRASAWHFIFEADNSD